MDDEKAAPGGQPEGGSQQHYDDLNVTSPDRATDEPAREDIDAYIRHGWSLVPIPSGTKGPQTKGWNLKENALKSHADLLPGWGIGLAHAYSGTMALDIDDWPLAAEALKLAGIDLEALYSAPGVVQILSGRAGHGKLLFRMPAGLVLPSKKINRHDLVSGHSKVALELRCATQAGQTVQDVLPPSIHPETQQAYQWGGAPWQQMPVIPDALLTYWQNLLDQDKKREIKTLTPIDASWTEIQNAVDYCDADCGREEWRNVGMALHYVGAQTGDDERAFQTWDEWSKRSAKYPGPREMLIQWRSFKPNKPTVVALGTLFKHAQERGWQRPPPDVTHLFGPVSSQWGEPHPIVSELKPVPPFRAEALLPPVLRRWIMDEAERMPCPPDFIAAAAIVALGSIIGARCAIKPKSRDSWLIVPNLWGGIVGDPSAKKSPAWGAAMRPVDRLIAAAIEAQQAAMASYETDKMVFDAHKEAMQARIKDAAKKHKDDPNVIARELQDHLKREPSSPKLRRYKTNDSTVEKLGELLRDNPAGLLVHRDELVGLISSWDREGREGDRAFFLEAWNGNQSFDTDRIGRGHILIPNVCTSIFGGIQPDKLIAYLDQAAHALANDGMLQRFQMLVFPDPCPWEWRDREPNKAARDDAFAVFERLAYLDPVILGASPADDIAKFPHFRFAEDAQEVFIEWSTDLHRVRMPGEDRPIICQHLAKYDKLFPALALIFHLVDCVTDGTSGPVTKAAAIRAREWCTFLEGHARRCYGLLKDDGLRAAQALASKIERGAVVDGFTLRDIRRFQWRFLTTDGAIQAALDWLEDEGWVRSESVGGTGPGTGRRTVKYQLNPTISRRKQSGNTT